MIRGVVLWQAYLDRMTCKCFCDLEFAVISKVCVKIDASSCSMEGHVVAKSSPEVAARDGKMGGRSVALSRFRLEQAQLG